MVLTGTPCTVGTTAWAVRGAAGLSAVAVAPLETLRFFNSWSTVSLTEAAVVVAADTTAAAAALTGAGAALIASSFGSSASSVLISGYGGGAVEGEESRWAAGDEKDCEALGVSVA